MALDCQPFDMRRPSRLDGFRQSWRLRRPRNLRTMDNGRLSLGIGCRDSQCQRRDEDRGRALADKSLS
jgi:hypothetical protein